MPKKINNVQFDSSDITRFLDDTELDSELLQESSFEIEDELAADPEMIDAISVLARRNDSNTDLHTSPNAMKETVKIMLNMNAFAPLTSEQIYNELKNPNSRTGARIKSTLQKRAVRKEVYNMFLQSVFAKLQERKRIKLIRRLLAKEEFYVRRKLEAYIKAQNTIKDSWQKMDKQWHRLQEFSQYMDQLRSLNKMYSYTAIISKYPHIGRYYESYQNASRELLNAELHREVAETQVEKTELLKKKKGKELVEKIKKNLRNLPQRERLIGLNGLLTEGTDDPSRNTKVDFIKASEAWENKSKKAIKIVEAINSGRELSPELIDDILGKKVNLEEVNSNLKVLREVSIAKNLSKIKASLPEKFTKPPKELKLADLKNIFEKFNEQYKDDADKELTTKQKLDFLKSCSDKFSDLNINSPESIAEVEALFKSIQKISDHVQDESLKDYMRSIVAELGADLHAEMSVMLSCIAREINACLPEDAKLSREDLLEFNVAQLSDLIIQNENGEYELAVDPVENNAQQHLFQALTKMDLNSEEGKKLVGLIQESASLHKDYFKESVELKHKFELLQATELKQKHQVRKVKQCEKVCQAKRDVVQEHSDALEKEIRNLNDPALASDEVIEGQPSHVEDIAQDIQEVLAIFEQEHRMQMGELQREMRAQFGLPIPSALPELKDPYAGASAPTLEELQRQDPYAGASAPPEPPRFS